MSEIPSRLLVYRHLSASAVNGAWTGRLKDVEGSLGLRHATLSRCVLDLHEEGCITFVERGTPTAPSRIELSGPEPKTSKFSRGGARKDAWTPEMKAYVTKLWADGHACTAIGKATGFGKNSIIGMIHRMKLPSRGSPIGRLGPKPVMVIPPPPEPVAPSVSVPRPVIPRAKPIVILKPRVPQQEPAKMEKPAPAAVMPPMPAVNADRIIRAMLPMAYVIAPQYPREVPVAAPGKAAASGYGQCRYPLWPDGARPTHVYCDAPTDPDAPLDFSWCKDCRKKALNPLPMRKRVAVAY